MIRVLIIDDHPIMRQGMALLINQEDGLEACGEAEDTAEAMEQIQNLKPDVVTVDLTIKGSLEGIELIKNIKMRYPNLPMLALSVHDESVYAERVLRAGAKGYVMKETATEKIITAIRDVVQGKIYLSPKMSSHILEKLVHPEKTTAHTFIDHLSDRELEVFQLIGHGYSTRQIAEKLYLSIKTVETHKARIKEKLKLKNASELAYRAVNWAQNKE